MVPITVGVASPRGSLAYDSLSRTLLASRGVYAVVGVATETGSVDANRGVALIVGLVLERNEAAWIRELRAGGDRTPVIAICRPAVARAAVAAGADGILDFSGDRLELERALSACATGGRWVPAELESGTGPVGIPVTEVDETDGSELADIVAMARSRATA